MSQSRLGSEDAGRVVPIRQQDPICVELAENPTTGFLWSVEPSCLADFEVIADERASDIKAPGAAVTRRITLTARHPGRLNLDLRLARPWEAGEADRWHVVVEVTP